MVITLEDVNLTVTQWGLLGEIHALARRMEFINNRGKARALIALLEELSADILSPTYLVEKLNFLFDFNPTFSYKYRE